MRLLRARRAAQPADAAAGEKAIDEGRYVDETGKKLGPGMTENAEFKRMPIFLRLQIDQRQILRFLVECANSPLPVEVRQLRINPTKGTANTPSTPPGGSKTPGGEANSFDTPLELHGIIYIYNKPDLTKLGGPPPAAPGAGAAAGAPPAAPPVQVGE